MRTNFAVARTFIATTLLVLVLRAAQPTIRNVDLRNFSYPFIEKDAVPDALRWMPAAGQKTIALKEGRLAFPSEDCDSPSGCPLLTLDTVEYGRLTGLPQENALVVMTYHTGGTANWQYVYVVGLRSGKPQVIAWLETGSRAYEGLRKTSIDRGDLVIIVNDPEKREGDCCSSGTISTRYRWHRDTFHQIGQRVHVEELQ